MFFSDKLVDHVGNSLDHVKMLPGFLAMGYDNQTFIQDALDHKITDGEVASIKKHFKKRYFLKIVYGVEAIDLYTGKYFAAKACPCRQAEYSSNLVKLQSIDPELFALLESLHYNWIMFDIENEDPLKSYHLFLFDFIHQLEKWTKGKIIRSIYL